MCAFPLRIVATALALVTSAALLAQPADSQPATSQPRTQVGPAGPGATVVPTMQLVRPAGDTIELNGRPVDIALSPDGARLIAKDHRGLVVVDVTKWAVTAELKFAGKGGSPIGLAISRDGARVFATSADDSLHEFALAADGTASKSRTIKLPGPSGKDLSFPCGIALAPNEATAFVCLSRNNSLAVVDLAGGTIVRQIETGIAPFDVALSPDGKTAYVSCSGGRRPRPGEPTATSAGTPVAIDARGIATTGGVSIIDLATGSLRAELDTGLSASDLALSPDGRRLFVANANSDSVSVIDTEKAALVAQIAVKPDATMPFGSMPCGLELSPDGRTLAVACGGNNAIALVGLEEADASRATIRGWIPAGWFPAAIAWRERMLFVANVKGIGSRNVRESDGAYNTHRHRGSLQRVEMPDAAAMRAMTAQVLADGRVPQMLQARERSERAQAVAPRPVPAQAGDPSVFEHVVYVIKENRTYDQVFGALGKGNGEPKLCTFGREITPNQHALAEQFVLLDNYYCNGVLSADGHSWATEGNVTPYLERAFGGFNRSYTFGDDPLTYSSSGFVWDHVLAAGRSFRNYGEFDQTEIVVPEGKPKTWATVYEDWKAKAGAVRFTHSIGVENVRRYTHPDSCGWNMSIPDQHRADVFLAEFRTFEQSGDMPGFIVLYLPQNHTSGVTEGEPTPRACVADNDLALGRVVEAVSQSRFWPTTCVFVIEDDPQNGWDHVDGHRSLCHVISPYTRRGAVVSNFYNQASVVHTMERILGCAPAANQNYALAPLMDACFVDAPDLAAFTALPNRVPLDELNPKKAAAQPRQRELYELTARLNLRKPDAADEDTLNRVLWHSVRGEERYPADFAGAHGLGLAALGLKLDARGGVDEDD